MVENWVAQVISWLPKLFWLIFKDIFLVINTKLACFPFNYNPTYRELGRPSASWSSGRVQDSGSGCRSSPEFSTLPVRRLVVPLSKALHTAMLLSTQEQMGTCEGRFVSRGAMLRVSGCILPRELRWIFTWIYAEWKGPITREGTCQSLQSRALSLDVDSKHWFTFTFYSSQGLQLQAQVPWKFNEVGDACQILPESPIDPLKLENLWLIIMENSICLLGPWKWNGERLDLSQKMVNNETWSMNCISTFFFVRQVGQSIWLGSCL